MKIAVVGGGVAGLSAAWALSTKHDVVLFEKDSVAGGHARTIDVSVGTSAVPADFGFLIFHPWCYTNFLALLKHLGLKTRPVSPGVTVSADFADGSRWSHHCSTQLSARFRPEVDRFNSLMRQVVADPASWVGSTLCEFLTEHKFTNEFQEKMICPVLSMLFVTRFGSLDIGVLAAAVCFGPVPLLNLTEPMPFATIEGGSREYVTRLMQEIGEVRLNCPVQGIERNANGVTLRVKGASEAFDHVILATDAATALRLLDAPSALEQKLLGEVEYEACQVVVHTDATVMPANDDQWAAYSFMAAGCHSKAQRTHSNYHLRQVQSWIEEDIFVTANPPADLIDPQKVIHRQNDWKHIRGDLLQYVRAAEMYRIQGKQRTWHCGVHIAESAWHEGSLRTGLAIAAALGADYPFADDPAASQGFHDTAVQLMRVLPARSMKSIPASIWPQPVLALVRRAMKHHVRREIRDKLRLGLPEFLFHPASPLAWLREALVRSIESRISPYDEFKKTFKPTKVGTDADEDSSLRQRTSTS